MFSEDFWIFFGICKRFKDILDFQYFSRFFVFLDVLRIFYENIRNFKRDLSHD